MTIAALVRGREGTYNALLADTGAVRSDGSIHRHDKLHRVFGETWVTAVGDACVLVILANKMRTSKKRPNLRAPDVINGICSELVDARRTGLLLGVPTAFPPSPLCTMLAVCNRAEVFFWKLTLDPETGAYDRPTTPTPLRSDSMVVLRGNTVAQIDGFFTVDAVEIEAVSFGMMTEVNASIERDGWEKLPYDLERRISGIVLPHRTSDKATRIDPRLPPMPVVGLAEPR